MTLGCSCGRVPSRPLICWTAGSYSSVRASRSLRAGRSARLSNRSEPAGPFAAVPQELRPADHERIGPADLIVVPALVAEPGEHVPHRFQPGAPLVVAAHNRPRRVGHISKGEHGLSGLGVLIPLVE